MHYQLKGGGMKRLAGLLAAVFFIVLELTALIHPSWSYTFEQGCPTCCDICNIIFKPEVMTNLDCAVIDDSESCSMCPIAINLVGAIWVDANNNGIRDYGDLWVIKVECQMPRCGQGECQRNGDWLVRHYIRPWTPTGMYWQDYYPRDPKVTGRAERNRFSPAIRVWGRDGWSINREDPGVTVRNERGDIVYSTTMSGYTNTASQNQTMRSDYTYDAAGHITKAVTKDVTGTVLLSTLGRYYATSGSGTVVRKRRTEVKTNSDGSSDVRTTLYGYYGDDSPWVGKLKYIVRPQGVAKYLNDHPADGVDPANPELACNLDTLADSVFEPLASVVIQEYVEFTRLDVFDENLNNLYDDQITLLKPSKVKMIEGSAGCSSCGSGEGGVTMRYSYVQNPNYQSELAGYQGNANEAKNNTWFTSCQSNREDGSGNSAGPRSVSFANMYMQPIYQVKQEMNVGTIGRVWFTHSKYNEHGQTIETRNPSACMNYGYGSQNGWITSVTPVVGVDGLVTLSGYDAASGNNMAWTKVQRGTNGANPAIMQGKTTWLERNAQSRKSYHIYEEIQYPSETTDENAADRLVTQHAYQFVTDTQTVEYETVTYPTVTTDKNGPNTATQIQRHFQKVGDLYWMDWQKYQDGTLSYNEIGTSGILKSKTLKSIEDADTSKSSDFAYPPPTGWSTPSGAGIHWKTSYSYYETQSSAGQLKSVASPDGKTSRMAYLSVNKTISGKVSTTALVTLSAPHMDAQGKYDYVPVNVQVDCVIGRNLIAATGVPTTGADGELVNDIQAGYLNGSLDLRNLQGGFNGTLATRSDSLYNAQYQLAESRQYYLIPASGEGSTSANYLSATYAYNSITGLHDRTRAPDGNVTMTVNDLLWGNVETWLGVSDKALADVTTSDLSIVGRTVYDENGVGDGNVTRTKLMTSPTTSLDTRRQYDWRNRVVATLGPDQLASISALDNLGRATSSSVGVDADGNFQIDANGLRGYNESDYDELGRIYRSRRYCINPYNGAQGNHLTSKYWYDLRDRQIKSADANGLFNKTKYDSLGRAVETYLCYDDGDSVWADAGNVVGDTVIEQAVNTFDGFGNVIKTVNYQRTSTATLTGSLAANWQVADSRRTFQYMWYDALDRLTYSVKYGTNDGVEPPRPPTPPEPNTSDNYIVGKTEFDSKGRPYQATDNKGRKTQRVYDDMGRVTRTIENYVDGVVTATETDTDRTTDQVYDSSGRLWKIIAYNPKGTSVEQQVTQYIYGTTATSGTPSIYRNDLLVAEIYPDSDDIYASGALGNGTDGVYDRIEYRYDYASRLSKILDQRGSERTLSYDSSGRMFRDEHTVRPLGIDTSIRSIEYGFDSLSRVDTITSKDASGTTVNQVKKTFDGWGNVIKYEQNHVGAVGTGTPATQFAFVDGAVNGEAKYVRLSTMTYPNGVKITSYNYPTSGVGDKLNRVDNITDEASHTMLQYTYLGAGTVTKVAHPQVTGGLNLDYGTTGHPSGWDRFGRVIDQRWCTDASVDKVRIQHAYDRTGNKQYADDLVLTSANDEYYTYDGLDRLVNWQRGNLNVGKTGIDGTPKNENQYTLEPLGNWKNFLQKADGITILDQQRYHNYVNEIDVDNDHNNSPGDSITATIGLNWADPTYDAAGNMKFCPKPLQLDQTFTLTWDAWNRLVKVTNTVGGATIAEYQYDGQHHRIVKFIPNGVNWDRTDFYETGGWQEIEERVLNNTSSKTTPATQLSSQYVFDIRYIDAVTVRDFDSNGDGTIDTRHYYMQDVLHSILSMMSTGGAIMERYKYAPYGGVTVLAPDGITVRSISSYDNPWTFTGRRGDDETGLMYYRARMYSTEIGRFLSRDPILAINNKMWIEVFTWNVKTLKRNYNFIELCALYTYVKSQPGRYTDPSGLKRCCIDEKEGFKAPHDKRDISIKADKGQLKMFFEMKATFLNTFDKDGNPDCCCECCEYRQYVKGEFIVDNEPEEVRITNGLLEKNNYNEDGVAHGHGLFKHAHFGHRDEPELPNDIYKNPDRKKGCSYNGTDRPGFIPILAGHKYEVKLKFEGKIIDVCPGNNNKTVDTKNWTVELEADLTKEKK